MCSFLPMIKKYSLKRANCIGVQNVNVVSSFMEEVRIRINHSNLSMELLVPSYLCNRALWPPIIHRLRNCDGVSNNECRSLDPQDILNQKYFAVNHFQNMFLLCVFDVGN